MRRQITALAMAVGVALAVAGPVAAWDSVNVTITGDGAGGGTIAVNGGLMPSTLLVTPTLEARPTGDLGARFTATYRIFEGGPVVAVQDLYPYADGGPVSFTSTAGAIGGHPYTTGWRQAAPSVLDALRASGLPAAAPAAAPNGGSEAGRSSATAESPAGSPVAVIALGYLAVLAVALFVMAIRRLAAARRIA